MPSDLELPSTPFSTRNPGLTEIWSWVREIAPRLGKNGLADLLNVAFWASLSTEEGQPAQVRLTVEPTDPSAADCLLLQSPVPFTVEHVVKLSPALAASRVYLGIRCARRRPSNICGLFQKQGQLSIEAHSPAHLRVNVYGGLVADLRPGAPIRVLDPWSYHWKSAVEAFLSDGHPFLAGTREPTEQLRCLAKAMQHGRGGTILFTDTSREDALEGLDLHYAVERDLFRLEERSEAWRVESKNEREKMNEKVKELVALLEGIGPEFRSRDMPAEQHYRRVARLFGRLTAIDGATVLDHKCQLLGFGAKIRALTNLPNHVEQAEVVPYSDTFAFGSVDTSTIGGMRHRSALQFVHDHPQSMALVVSQDGRTTLIAGTRRLGFLRCESLLD